MSHFVGSLVQAPSSPLVIVSAPLPVPKVFFQPRPCSSTRAALGLRTDVVGAGGTVALAERVAADDERDRLLVVHRHAGEGLADVAGGGERIRVAVRALRVHVDQAHLHGAERTGELPVAAVALVAEPRVLGAPEDLVGLPDVLVARSRSRTS